MVFTKPFFSVAGQKERISNVGKVLGIATGIYNPTKTTIQSNTGSKTANKVLEVVSNHPYATAGAVASVTTAVKLAPSIVASKASSLAGMASLSTGTKLAVAGAGAFAVGSLFGKSGGNSNPIQNTTPKQEVSFIPEQKTEFSPSVMPTQNDTSSQSGTGNIWNQTKTQNTYSQNYNYQTPTQENNPYIPVSQETNPDLTSTGGSESVNWVTIALMGAGLYFLAKD